jgi:hypothetical protein
VRRGDIYARTATGADLFDYLFTIGVWADNRRSASNKTAAGDITDVYANKKAAPEEPL